MMSSFELVRRFFWYHVTVFIAIAYSRFAALQTGCWLIILLSHTYFSN